MLAVLELKMKSIKIEDGVITNHLGVKKGTASRLSGIPIKEIFQFLVLTNTDVNTGRRFIKSLNKIVIQKGP